MTSYGKPPRDKISAYAKERSNWSTTAMPSQSTGARPNSDALKKKHYRARGCRGGASRKGRKKQLNRQPSNDDREELDDLNPSPSLPTSGFVANDIDDEQSSKVSGQNQPQNVQPSYDQADNPPPKKVTFAPHNPTETHSYSSHNFIESKEGGGSKLHKFMHPFAGFGKSAATTTQPKSPTSHMAILPKESDAEGNIELTLLPDENSHPNSIISPAHRTGVKGSPARSPGFSFFSISPRSYLTGRKSKAQKLSH